MFQSLSGLSLGLNILLEALIDRFIWVSIPFRAVTGFEHESSQQSSQAFQMFQSLSGLSLGLNLSLAEGLMALRGVSIPFRAVTGFEHDSNAIFDNPTDRVSIPFRAVTGFEHHKSSPVYKPMVCFNPFQGCHWV